MGNRNYGVILCSTSPATVVHLDGVPDERRHRAVVVLGVVDVVGVVGVKLLTDQRVSGGGGSPANAVVADEARDAVVAAVAVAWNICSTYLGAGIIEREWYFFPDLALNSAFARWRG